MEDLGSTFLGVLERDALELQQHNSKLMLVGVGPLTRDQLEKTKIAETIGRENIFMRTETIGEAATLAWDAAQKWLAEQPERLDDAPEEAAPPEPAQTPHLKDALQHIEKAGESAVKAWDNAQEWVAELRENSDKTPPPQDEEDRTVDKH